MAKEPLYLHAVIFNKSVGIGYARKHARKIMQKVKVPKAYETEESFRFKNIPKSQFVPDSFRSKKIDDNLTLVFGHLKPGIAE